MSLDPFSVHHTLPLPSHFHTATCRLHREVTAERRHKEVDALQKVKDVLPLSKTQLDQAKQASVISLTVNYLRLREMMDATSINYGEGVGCTAD